MQGQYKGQTRDLKGRYDADGKPIQNGEGQDSAAQNRPVTTLYDIVLQDLKFRQQNMTKGLIGNIRMYLNKTPQAPLDAKPNQLRDIFFKFWNDTTTGRISVYAVDPDDPGSPLNLPVHIVFGPGDVSATRPFMLLTLLQSPTPTSMAAMRIRPYEGTDAIIPPASYMHKDIQVIIENKGSDWPPLTVETRNEEPFRIGTETFYQKFRISCSPDATIEQVKNAINSIKWESITVFQADILGDVMAGIKVSDVIADVDAVILRYIPVNPTVRVNGMNENFFQRFFNAAGTSVKHSVLKYTVAGDVAYFDNPGVYGFVFRRTDYKGTAYDYEMTELRGMMRMEYLSSSKSFIRIPNHVGPDSMSGGADGYAPLWYANDNPLFNGTSELTSVELDTELVFVPFIEVTDQVAVFATGFTLDLNNFRAIEAYKTLVSGMYHNMSDPTQGSRSVESQILFDSNAFTNAAYYQRLEALYRRLWLQNSDPMPTTASALEVWEKFKFGAVKYTRDVVIIDTAVTDSAALRDCRIYSSLSAAVADIGVVPPATSLEPGRPLAPGDRVIFITGGSIARPIPEIPNGLPSGIEYMAVLMPSGYAKTAADPDFSFETATKWGCAFIVPATFSGTFPEIYAPNAFFVNLYVADGLTSLTITGITAPVVEIYGDYLLNPTPVTTVSLPYGNKIGRLAFLRIYIDQLTIGDLSAPSDLKMRNQIDRLDADEASGYTVINEFRLGIVGAPRNTHIRAAQLTVHGGLSRSDPFDEQVGKTSMLDQSGLYIKFIPVTWQQFAHTATQNYVVKFTATPAAFPGDSRGIIENLNLILDIAFTNLSALTADTRDLSTIQDLIFVEKEIRGGSIIVNLSGTDMATRGYFLHSPGSSLPEDFMFLNCGMTYAVVPSRPSIGGLFMGTRIEVNLTDYVDASNLAPLFTQDLFTDSPDLFYFADRNITDAKVRLSERCDLRIAVANKHTYTVTAPGMLGWAPTHDNENIYPVIAGAPMELWHNTQRFLSGLRSSKLHIPSMIVKTNYDGLHYMPTPANIMLHNTVLFSDMPDTEITVDNLMTIRTSSPGDIFFPLIRLLSSRFEAYTYLNAGVKLRVKNWLTQAFYVSIGGLGMGSEVDLTYYLNDSSRGGGVSTDFPHCIFVQAAVGASIKIRSGVASYAGILDAYTLGVKDKFVDKMNGFVAAMPYGYKIDPTAEHPRLYTLYLADAINWTDYASTAHELYKLVADCHFDNLMVEDIIAYGPMFHNHGGGFWMQYGYGPLAKGEATQTSPAVTYPRNAVICIQDTYVHRNRWFRAIKNNVVCTSFDYVPGPALSWDTTAWLEIDSGFTYPRYHLFQPVPATTGKFAVWDTKFVTDTPDLQTFLKTTREMMDGILNNQKVPMGTYDWRDDNLLMGSNRFTMWYMPSDPSVLDEYDDNGVGYTRLYRTNPLP